MKRLFTLAALTALTAALAGRAAPGVQAAGSTFVNTGNPGDSMLAYHVYGTEGNSRGFSLDGDTTGSPLWGLGLERTYNDVYLYGYTAATTPLRLRGDTGQLELGPNVGHPASSSQLNVSGGSSGTPRIGLGVGVWGNQFGLYLYQNQAVTKRTNISLNNVYVLGSDSTQNGTADFWLYNLPSGHTVLTANADDSLSVNYGATIAGALKLTTGSTLGFYGAAPMSKPTINGCRSDGTALKDLLTKLSAMGLITDNTTP